MPSFIDGIKCENCGEDSITYERIRRGPIREVKFWISPYLPLEKVRHVFSSKRREHYNGTYDLLLKCPACGEWIEYTGIPTCWRAYIPDTQLLSIPIDEIIQFAPEAIVAMNLPKKMKEAERK